MSEDIQKLLDKREKTHGDFRKQSRMAQGLKEWMRHSPNYSTMPQYMREALEMIATKMARIGYGDRDNVDSWRDIGGYSALVVRELEKK